MPGANLNLSTFLSLSGWKTHIPHVLMSICSSVGKAAVPCYLITVGAGAYPFPSLRPRGLLAYLAVVRLVVLPALIVSIVRLLSLPRDVRSIAFVVALMPTAIGSATLARRYDGDPDFAGAAAVVTTIASLVTVPIGLALIIR